MKELTRTKVSDILLPNKFFKNYFFLTEINDNILDNLNRELRIFLTINNNSIEIFSELYFLLHFEET